MGVWKPTRMVHWACFVGARPSELIWEHTEASLRWVRDVVAELSGDLSVSFVCHQGLARRHIAAELRSGRYDELVVGRALLGERCRAQLERAFPELRIELVDRVPRTPAPTGLP